MRASVWEGSDTAGGRPLRHSDKRGFPVLFCWFCTYSTIGTFLCSVYFPVSSPGSVWFLLSIVCETCRTWPHTKVCHNKVLNLSYPASFQVLTLFWLIVTSVETKGFFLWQNHFLTKMDTHITVGFSVRYRCNPTFPPGICAWNVFERGLTAVHLGFSL